MELTKTAVLPEGEDARSGRTKLPKNKFFTKQNIVCWVIVSIPLIAFLVFNGFTIVFSIMAMFGEMEYNQLDTLKWNNFANFIRIGEDIGTIWQSIKVTLVMVLAQFTSLTIAIIMAAFLSQSVKGTRFFQTLYFIPYVCSSVAVSIMWTVIFGWNGALNSLLGTNIDWLNNMENPSTLTWAIFISVIWQAPGYGIVMYCSAFKSINPALYEAAELDGANTIQKFWYVTLPGISTITFFLVLAGITAGLTTFDAARIMAPMSWDGYAGPENAGLALMYYIYIEGVQFGNMGYASILSWLLFIVMMIPSVYLIRKRILSLEDL